MFQTIYNKIIFTQKNASCLKLYTQSLAHSSAMPFCWLALGGTLGGGYGVRDIGSGSGGGGSGGGFSSESDSEDSASKIMLVLSRGVR